MVRDSVSRLLSRRVKVDALLKTENHSFSFFLLFLLFLFLSVHRFFRSLRAKNSTEVLEKRTTRGTFLTKESGLENTCHAMADRSSIFIKDSLRGFKYLAQREHLSTTLFSLVVILDAQRTEESIYCMEENVCTTRFEETPMTLNSRKKCSSNNVSWLLCLSDLKRLTKLSERSTSIVSKSSI